MATTLRLEDEQVLALRRAIFVTRQLTDAAEEIGDELLEELDLMILGAFTKKLCHNCSESTSRRRSGLCDRCHTYEVKYGRLPSRTTIDATARRRFEESIGPTSRRPATRRGKTGP